MSEQPSSNQMCQKYDWLKCPDDPEKQCSECQKKIEQRTSKEWATRARFEKIKAEMPKGMPGYSEFRFNWMHDALRELIDYCDALHADEPAALTAILEATADAEFDCSASYFRDAARKAHRIARAAIEESRAAQPPSVTPSNPMVEASLHHITAALLSLSNARCVALGQTKKASLSICEHPHVDFGRCTYCDAVVVAAGETNDAQCNGNCFLVGGPFVAEDPSCPKHGNH